MSRRGQRCLSRKPHGLLATSLVEAGRGECQAGREVAASAHGHASPDADDAAVEPTLTVAAGGVAATCPDAVTVISSAATEVWLRQASE